MKKQIVFLIILASFQFIGFGQIGYNVDVLPSNIGGKAELKRVFKQELRYPAAALAAREGGEVVIDFVIRADSSITDTKIKKGVSPAIDAEALRLFKLLQWYPPVKDDVRQACNWSTSFVFEPEKYARICKERGFVNFPYISVADTSGTIEKKPQQLPMYPEGNFALKDFIKAHLEYPHQAQLSNLQGVVVLRFVVEPSGLVTNIGVKTSIGGGCDEEAIRVLKLIKWYPAKKNNVLVRAELAYPFYFVLNDEFKDNSIGSQK
ncbi:MAG TPA: energy transducer TonB [Bacteroidia bacterium]|jgi:TonB family protein|nr:energy transducer TonB [Bacteroidia bacterium]